MADVFREVDEEVRQDRIAVAFARNWGWILLAALLLITGVGAWRAYEYLRQQRAEEAGETYLAALKLAQSGKSAEALAAFEAIGTGKATGYGLLARFRAAAEKGATSPADGAKAYDALADDGSVDPALRNVARLRAAALLIDTLDLAALKTRLDPLADANSALRNPARELLAFAALKANNNEAAGQWLDAIVADPTALPGSRQRAELLLSLVRSGKAAKP